ncbi:YncE family protein [Sphingomonas sp. URHD0057]|uniref:YncE family protein n=1 Tax=Sphingomonas sp. URHD0057 TaxID=1380389 RepID=UPI000685B61B|nr:cytochrome D1 domain-containing protein [Sphingomonas sp. URHD0057]
MRRGLLSVLSAALLGLAPNAAQAGDLLLVANKRENTVSFIDLARAAELGRAKTGSTPHELAASPDGHRVAVVAYGGHTIDILDIASRSRLRTIDLGRNAEPHGIAWLRNGRIVVTTQASDAVAVIDPIGRDTLSTIPTRQKGTHLLAVSPNERRLYTANRESGTVSVLDLKRRVDLRNVRAGIWPEGIALTRSGRELWVADFENARVLVYDARTMRRVASLRTGRMPIRVAAAPDGRRMYTSDTGAGSVSEFDARSHRLLRQLRISGNEAAQQVTLAFSSDGKRLYVAETARNTVAEVDLKSGAVLRRLKAGDGGDGLAVVAGGGG